MAKSKSMPKSKEMPQSTGKGKAKNTYQSVSRSVRAGVLFPVGRIHRYLRKGKYAKRIGQTAPVYLAGILEYLVAEVMELSGNAARDNKRKRIIPRDINLAILQDAEIKELLSNVTISRGGVIPNILEVLLKPKRN